MHPETIRIRPRRVTLRHALAILILLVAGTVSFLATASP
jgi:hypothetical protein